MTKQNPILDSPRKDVLVDFDGTVVQWAFPHVGDEVPGAVSALKEIARRGHRIILHTNRCGKELRDAVEWFRARNIPLYAVNENPSQHAWTESPKVYGHFIIDDLCACIPVVQAGKRPYVDWEAVWRWLDPQLADLNGRAA